MAPDENTPEKVILTTQDLTMEGNPEATSVDIITWDQPKRMEAPDCMAMSRTVLLSLTLELSVPGEPDSKKPQGSSRTSLNCTVTWGHGFFLGPCLPWVQTS